MSTPASPVPSNQSDKPGSRQGSEEAVGQLEASTSKSVSDAEGTSASAPDSTASTPAPPVWQAIFSPQHNAYYFHNAITQETTWSNPLQPSAAASGEDVGAAESSASVSTTPPAPSASPQPDPADGTSAYPPYTALQAAAAAQGIDPSLAYLDPTLAGPSTPGAFTYTAKFNARTGAFAKPDGRDPTHLSEYERAKRMSEFYFDVGAWERDVEDRKRKEKEEEESGQRKKKKPTKKDLERFKEQKKQKKIAKTAWLRT